MAKPTTSEVYGHVINDVVSKVREEFVNNGGPGQSLLNELQRLWEMKMLQVGSKKSSGVHDLKEPYEGDEEYETPTAEMLFPPSPLAGTAQTPTTADSSLYNIRTGGTSINPIEFSFKGDPISRNGIKIERLHPYLKPPRPWLNQRHVSVDVNVAYKEGREELARGISRQSMTQTPLPGMSQTPVTADSSLYNIRSGATSVTPNEFSSRADPISLNGKKSGRPSPRMQPPRPWMNQRPMSVDMNAAYKEGMEELGRGIFQQSRTQNFFTFSAGKRKREDFASQYYNGGFIPQQNRVGDTVSYGFQIPQLDGPIPGPYGNFSTPNIYNYQRNVQEDYNIASTSAPHNHASTPAAVTLNDVGDDDDNETFNKYDDDDETLNENDDDGDDFNDGDFDDDLNSKHLVLAQFDKVKRTKSKWTCSLKNGIIMHINNEDILFNKANGEFHF